MSKKEVDEMFVLHHLDLRLSEEEVDDLIEESDGKQRERWLERNGYSFEEEEDD